MSRHDGWMRELLSIVTDRGYMNVLPEEVMDVSLGKSSHHCMAFLSLFMINSLDSSSLKPNAPSPSRMEVNSGKSIHHSLPVDSLSNTTREQL